MISVGRFRHFDRRRGRLNVRFWAGSNSNFCLGATYAVKTNELAPALRSSGTSHVGRKDGPNSFLNGPWLRVDLAILGTGTLFRL